MSTSEEIMYHIFSNPRSKSNRGNRTLNRVERILQSRGVDFTSYVCSTPEVAKVQLDEIIASGGGDIIVVGGDGTLFNIINSISDFSKIRIGIVAAGTGNDFARTLKVSKNLEDSIDDILSPDTHTIDIMQVGDYKCVNVAGTGLDIEVLKRYNKMKFFDGKIKYYLALLITLFKFRFYKLRVTLGEDESFEVDGMFVSVGNGKYIGGGMNAVPNARPDDGLLDVTIVRSLPGIKIVTNLLHFLKGNHHKSKYIDSYTTRGPVKVEILEDTQTIQMDGEMKDSKFECSIIPNALTLLNTKQY